MAEVFKTISFGYDNNIFKDINVMNDKLAHIENMINDGVFDKVTFEFNIPTTADNPEYLMKIIKDKYRFNNDVKLNIVHGYNDEKKKKNKEEIEKWNIENAPIFDKNKSIEDKVSFFIRLEFKREIKPERVNLYLNYPLSEILERYE